MTSVTWGMDHSKKQKQYGKDRICTHDGCKTKLSIYNPKNTCSLHTPSIGGSYVGTNGRGAR